MRTFYIGMKSKVVEKYKGRLGMKGGEYRSSSWFYVKMELIGIESYR